MAEDNKEIKCAQLGSMFMSRKQYSKFCFSNFQISRRYIFLGNHSLSSKNILTETCTYITVEENIKLCNFSQVILVKYQFQVFHLCTWKCCVPDKHYLHTSDGCC